MRFDDYKTHLKHFNTVLIHALKAIPLTSLINRLDMQGLFSVLVFITPTQGSFELNGTHSVRIKANAAS